MRASWQRCYLRGRASRRRFVEMLGIHAVHLLKIVEVGHVDRASHGIIQGSAGFRQDRFDVGERLAGFGRDAPWNQFAGFRIDPFFAGHENKIPEHCPYEYGPIEAADVPATPFEFVLGQLLLTPVSFLLGYFLDL